MLVGRNQPLAFFLSVKHKAVEKMLPEKIPLWVLRLALVGGESLCLGRRCWLAVV